MDARKRRHAWQPACPQDIVLVVESFHLPDRLRARVPHQQRFAHERVPAVLELCVQAGVDVPGLRAVRRAEPVDAGGSAQGGEGALRRLESAQRGVYSRKDADLVRDSLQLAQLDAIGEQVTWEVAAAAKQREVAARLSASLSSAQLHLLHGADEGLGGGGCGGQGGGRQGGGNCRPHQLAWREGWRGEAHGEVRRADVRVLPRGARGARGPQGEARRCLPPPGQSSVVGESLRTAAAPDSHELRDHPVHGCWGWISVTMQ